MNNRINYAGFVDAQSKSGPVAPEGPESAVALPPLDFRGTGGGGGYDPAAAVQALRRIASGES
jgi:hypothetical protein